MSKERVKIAKLKEAYKRIPNANCKGLCQEACSMVGFSKLEGQRMTEAAGKPPFLTDDATCGYLSEGKCSVYEQRPAICRLYGSTQKLACQFGCEPDGGRLEEEISNQILDEIDKINGGHVMYSNFTHKQALNMKLGKPLSAPLSSSPVPAIETIVPFTKKR